MNIDQVVVQPHALTEDYAASMSEPYDPLTNLEDRSMSDSRENSKLVKSLVSQDAYEAFSKKKDGYLALLLTYDDRAKITFNERIKEPTSKKSVTPKADELWK